MSMLPLLAAALVSVPLFAQTPVTTNYLENSRLIGSATYTSTFRSLYEISLFSEEEIYEGRLNTYVFEIGYLRDFSKDDVIDRFVSQIRVTGYLNEIRLAQWHAQLVRMFPDELLKGSLLTVVLRDTGDTHFYHNGQHIGHLRDPAFRWRFMAIWLGNKGSESRLRDELTGGSESLNPIVNQNKPN